MKHPLIIGAGGVASYLLPVLLKTFQPKSVCLIDKDILEKRNLDRQLFDAKFIGKNKAEALASIHLRDFLNPSGKDEIKVSVKKEWFTSTTEIPDETDVIICVADNHLARKEALDRADKALIPCVLGGNEYIDNEAYIYYPQWKGTERDPRIRYPEILTSHDAGSPLACTGIAQEASPQLAMANSGCAAKILHLLWVWERFRAENELTKEAVDCLPYELSTTLTSNTFR